MRFGFFLNPIIRLRGVSDNEPEPSFLAALAQSAGAQLILAGWQPGGGLLTERDIKLIRELVHIDLHIVTPISSANVSDVIKQRPEGVVIVDALWDGVRPARPLQPDTDINEITDVVASYRSAGMPVSILVEPDATTAKTVVKTGVGAVVLDCTTYTATRRDEEAESALDRIADASMAYARFGLSVAVSHKLTYHSVGPIASLRNVEEVYVGQAVAVRAVQVGLDRAIREMLDTIHLSRAEH